MDFENSGFQTKAVHGGQHGDPATGALVAPMFMTSTYSWTEEKMERYINGDKDGIFTYGRSRNPTQNDLQTKLSLLEGGKAALVTASGMAAISLALLSVLKPGDHVISAKTIYGGTHGLFTKIFEEMEIEVSFTEDMTYEGLSACKKDRTKVVYAETVYNPSMEVADIEGISKWTKENNVVFIVDNTFCSPYLYRPLEHGADVVVNSATKYINGHGDLIAGTICSNADFIEKIRSSIYQEFGPVSSPFTCWLMLRGLKTLPLRMRAHCENAMVIAKWLENNPAVDKVFYPGLESHPQHEMATKMFDGKGFGGMISFTVKGDISTSKAIIYHTDMIKMAVSLGDLDTLIELPATMTHGKIPKEERESMGIPDTLIRLSIGIEDPADIIADLEKAFAYVK